MSVLFISYTNRDPEGSAWADRLEQWCADWGYDFFRDINPSQGVKAGDDWRASLHRQLGLAQVVISLCSPKYETSPWCVWEIAAAVERGKWLIPIQLGRKEVPSLLQSRQVIAVANARRPSAAQLAKVKQQLQVVLKEQLDWRRLQAWDPRQPPYPGLMTFTAEQAPVFFGQDGAIKALREQLASLAQRAPAALVVLGASGTGKSSLVRAGVLPRLAAEPEPWLLLEPFRPGTFPFSRLRKVLKPALAGFPKAPPLLAGKGSDALLLQQLNWLHEESEKPVLLMIDQLEELLVDDNPEAERFLAFMQGLLKQQLCGVVMIATLRTDFLALLEARWPALTSLIHTTTPEQIQPQRFGELISGPAARAELKLQAGLAEQLVAESKGRDALPLLAFTMEKLWLRRQERGTRVAVGAGAEIDITLDDLEAVGGVAGAVSQQAALCWDPRTTPEAETNTLKEAFVKHLVRLNDEGLATKQPARWEELPEASRPLLQRFVETRLLVRGGGKKGDVVEIAHEALLRTWEPLVEWIAEGRLELEQRRRVSRLCGDLGLKQPLEARLAALQGLHALAEADPQGATPAAETLGGVLSEAGRDPQEWPVAIRLLALIGGAASTEALSGFLEQQQLHKPTATEQAAPVLEVLCQAAAALQTIHRRTPPRDENDQRYLLLPSATVSNNGLALHTQLVRLRLWATPQLEAPGAWFEPLGQGEALTMVAIQAGSFLMGSPPDEMEREEEEGPQHLVTLKGFWISQAPITQAQWRQVMETNPSSFTGDRAVRDRRPVEHVSWHDAIEFCRRLGKQTARTYTLPSEAQWEFACRAGTTTPFCCGATILSELANFDGNRPYGESPKGVLQSQTSPVDQFPANHWGLHDMHGNVDEWCLDEWRSIGPRYWHGNYIGAPTDGSAWVNTEGKQPRLDDDDYEMRMLLRGGSWFMGPKDSRSAYRSHHVPDLVNNTVGFRVVCLP